MFIETKEDVNFYQFIVRKDREYGFDHLLKNLEIPSENVKKRIDKGGALIVLLDIYSLPNKNELRQALNKAQRDFV